jgi:glutamate-ammonia-ligase adenylyltransferase
LTDIWRRIREKTLVDAEPSLGSWVERTADPALCLAQLERWLEATSNPTLQLERLCEHPAAADPLLRVLGFSPRLGDALVQNPEFVDYLLDPDVFAAPYDSASEETRLRRMVGSVQSFTHRLDRLRLFKQQWTVRLAAHDLMGDWPDERIWEAISAVADSVVKVALETCWEKHCADREISEACPLTVIGFGKLGGHELNYSSDIDLAYVLPDDIEPDVHIGRFCESFGRALTDSMGRGWLYRVDLRLRPYGKSGPIVNRMAAVESYYRNYAEAWEHLALIRSRVIAGSPEIQHRWEAMRQEVCFGHMRGEWVFEEIASLRERTERIAVGDDLKRGPGGIRDVEFLAQLLQLLHGPAIPDLRVLPTHAALEGLEHHGLLPEAATLWQGYRLLRRLEHRLQMSHERQTHQLPEDPTAQLVLARSLGHGAWEDTRLDLERWRDSIRSTYNRWVRVLRTGRDRREETLGRLLSGRDVLARWIDALPDSAEYYRALSDNERSLARASAIARVAPVLVPFLVSNPAMTEAVLSGEIEEEIEGKATAANILRQMVRTIVIAEDDSCRALSGATESLLAVLTEPGLHAITLGSCAADELVWGGDCDLLLLSDDECEDPAAAAVRMVRAGAEVAETGVPFRLDLRLRPEGRQGALARSTSAFERYASELMEPWERMAVMRSRWVAGSRPLELWVRALALSLPLTPDVVVELQSIKRRVESERVGPLLMQRHVKLGRGGLMDIQWLASLLVWRTQSLEAPANTLARLNLLAEARELNVLEVGPLREGLKHHQRVRQSLALLGLDSDLVPENPDKLGQLAEVLGFPDGNSLLEEDRRVRDTVRALYEDSVARLQG